MSSEEQIIDDLFSVAEKAAEEYATYTLSQVEAIVHAVANAAAEKAGFYAEWSVRETGYGNVAAKTAKNIGIS